MRSSQSQSFWATGSQQPRAIWFTDSHSASPYASQDSNRWRLKLSVTGYSYWLSDVVMTWLDLSIIESELSSGQMCNVSGRLVKMTHQSKGTTIWTNLLWIGRWIMSHGWTIITHITLLSQRVKDSLITTRMISTGKLTSICQKRNWIMQDFVRFKVFASLTSQSESNWKSLPLSRLLGHTFNALFRITLAKWFSIQRMEIWLWSPVDNWIFMFPSPNVFVVNDNPIMDMMAVGAIWTNEVHDLPKDHLEHEPAKNNQRLSPLPGAFHQCQGQQSCPPLNDKALIWVPGLFHCARSRGPTQVSSAMQRLALQSS